MKRFRQKCYECGRFVHCEKHETQDGMKITICIECSLCVNYLKDDPFQKDLAEDLDFSE